MKFFDVPFDVVLIRYYLLMAVVVTSFMIGIPYLCFLALPIFLFAFMGINLKSILTGIKISKISSKKMKRKPTTATAV